MKGRVTMAALLDFQLECRDSGTPPMIRKEETGETGTVIRVETVGPRGVVLYDVSGHHSHLGFFVPESEFGKWAIFSTALKLPFVQGKHRTELSAEEK